MSRKFTNKLYEMLEDGLLNSDTVITACLKFMSEDDVIYMMKHNEFIDNEEEFDDEE